MSDIYPLDVSEVENTAYSIASLSFAFNEPLPPFATRYTGKLESCLETPFQGFGGFDPYPTLEDKATLLFYLIVKNHPFQNGNKRMAITTMTAFLVKHDKWPAINPTTLYEIAKAIAASDPKCKDSILPVLHSVIKGSLVSFSELVNK